MPETHQIPLSWFASIFLLCLNAFGPGHASMCLLFSLEFCNIFPDRERWSRRGRVLRERVPGQGRPAKGVLSECSAGWRGSGGCLQSCLHRPRGIQAPVGVGGRLPTQRHVPLPCPWLSPPLPPGILETSPGGRHPGLHRSSSPSWTKGGPSWVCPGGSGSVHGDPDFSCWGFCSLSDSCGVVVMSSNGGDGSEEG